MSISHHLTGWHGGTWPGGSYGLRFGRLRETWIEGKPDAIELLLEGEDPFRAQISPGFWKDCPEVRHQRIRDWIKAQGVPVPWPKENPPRFPVEKTGRNSFRVHRTNQ